MTRRYFAPDLPAAGGVVELPPQEALHASRVMRVAAGDELEVFDGQGNQAAAVVLHVKRDVCQLQSRPVVPVDRLAPVRLHLGIAFPKPDRAKRMIEQLTELGVAAVTLLVADRSQSHKSIKLDGGLERIVVEACKQSGRNDLMRLYRPIPLDRFADESIDSASVRLFAQPQTQPIAAVLASLRRDGDPGIATSPAAEVRVAIGPEGGFSDREQTLLNERGFVGVGLGPRIYRIETAATAMAALLIHR